MTMALPAQRVLNSELTKEVGRPVIKFEVLHIEATTTLNVTFVSKAGPWREGLWLATSGILEVAGTRSDQLTIWMDTAPQSFDISVVETSDGLLRLYNIWDSGRGLKRESLSATSGMLKEERPDGSIVYRANDIGRNPQFDKLVFEIRRSTSN